MQDPQLIDPDNGNYRVAEDSPASGYGCQTFVRNSSSRKPEPTTSFKNDTREALSGVISENTHLTSTEISVTDNVIIEDGVVLSLSPATTISFMGNYNIEVNGAIEAIGTADSRIVFTAEEFYLFANDDDLQGCWNGFKFINTNSNNQESRFEYCVFEYAKAVDETQSLVTDSGAVFSIYNYDKVNIENSIFRNNYAHNGSVLCLNKDSNINIISNQFYNNTTSYSASVAIIYYSNPRIFNNLFLNNTVLNSDTDYETGVIETFLSKPLLNNNIIYGNIDSYFEENQIFSVKDWHCKNNAFDFNFSGYNAVLDLIEFTLIDDYVYSTETRDDLIDLGAIALPFNYQLPALDISGNIREYGNRVDIGPLEYSSVDNDNSEQVPSLDLAVYPNPFNPETTISFDMPNQQNGILKIYNLKGAVVYEFPARSFSQGNNKFVWQGIDNNNNPVSSGVYFIKVKTTSFEKTSKVMLIK